ncbi:hypothetical protein PAEPH01_0305 [Pancytospora epiphaga]|nr:hypothetical protein PAEPH01_0305 [Pancytospora epiphaga]
MFGILALFASSIHGLSNLETDKPDQRSSNHLEVNDTTNTPSGIEYENIITELMSPSEKDLVAFETSLQSKATTSSSPSDGPNTQQLVFGSYHKDNGAEIHYCDVLLKPQRTISNVTVFLKTEESGKDSAVPKCMISPKSSSSKGFVRLELNDPSIERNESVYNFQIACTDGTIIHTEAWTFDAKTGKFSHASAVKRPFYKKKLFRYIAGGFLGAVFLALSFVIYRSIRKNKTTI